MHVVHLPALGDKGLHARSTVKYQRHAGTCLTYGPHGVVPTEAAGDSHEKPATTKTFGSLLWFQLN